MLTTKDNPYDPYTQFEQWQQWDEDNGYFTINYLARIANLPDDEEDDEVIDELSKIAMNDIVNNGPIDQWIIV